MPTPFYGLRAISFTVNASEDEIDEYLRNLPEERRLRFFSLLNDLDEAGLITLYRPHPGPYWIPEIIPYMK
ncbi:MAG: hypothetical protein HPY81_06485 [Firmicutes bacterium]|nr:hypothetical protein [Bacillota bacterium]